jgi:hypothetical protein
MAYWRNIMSESWNLMPGAGWGRAGMTIGAAAVLAVMTDGSREKICEVGIW